MARRADVARMLAEELAHDFAERAPAGAALTLEHERNLGLFVGMLHGPCQPVDGIGIDVIITRGHHLENVLAHIAPITAPRRYTPATPEIALAVDDGLAVRLEDDAGILLPVFMRKPELADVDDLAVRLDMTIEIEIAEVLEMQKRRHAIDVVLAAGVVLDLLEPQYASARAIEHYAIVAVEFGHHPLALWCLLLMGLFGALVGH